MRIICHSVVVAWMACLLVGVSVLTARAQSSQPPEPRPPRQLDITPFMALGDDLAPGGGVSLRFPMANRLTLEAEGSLGTDAARSSAGLLFDFARFGSVTTYVAGSLGVQRDEIDSMLFEPDTRKKAEFAVGIGGGATIPLVSRWSYRVDFRWYNPKAEWPESWRIYNGFTFSVSPRQ